MNTDTPETDAAWACFKGYMEPLQDVQDLSRKLERERAQAREIIDEAREVLKITQEAWVKAKAERVEALRERDEAREETIRTREFMDYGFAKAQEELATVTAQRDRLAEALQMITTFDCSDLQCDNGHGCRYVAIEALQSLTQKP
jgi:uncharacterized protein (DUF3084 family)